MTTLKYDDDFPIQFCPVCGSEHLTGGAIHDEVLGFDRWNQYCNTCHWKFEIFILKKGKTVFKFRSDSDNCKECNYESGGKVQKCETCGHPRSWHNKHNCMGDVGCCECENFNPSKKVAKA